MMSSGAPGRVDGQRGAGGRGLPVAGGFGAELQVRSPCTDPPPRAHSASRLPRGRRPNGRRTSEVMDPRWELRRLAGGVLCAPSATRSRLPRCPDGRSAAACRRSQADGSVSAARLTAPSPQLTASARATAAASRDLDLRPPRPAGPDGARESRCAPVISGGPAMISRCVAQYRSVSPRA